MLKDTLSALDFTVVIGEAKHRPQFKPGDLVAFEQHFGRSLVSPNGEATFGITEMMFLSWAALHRSGVVAEDFDAFCGVVDDIEVGDGPGKGL